MTIGGDYSSSSSYSSGSNNLYGGADYGLDPSANQEWFPEGQMYPIGAGQIGHASDATTANQLDAVNKKLNTGASVIEVSGINIMGGGPGAQMDKIPKQHFKEIERLKKLTGAELTFHAPMLEPSGFTKQGWSEQDRAETENQLWSAVARAQQLESKGNLVVTFHSGVVGVDAERKIKTTDAKGDEVEVIKEVGVMDVAKGQYSPLTIKPNYFLGDDGKIVDLKQQEIKIKKMLNKQSQDAWFRNLYGISYHASQGLNVLQKALQGLDKEGQNQALNKYKEFLDSGGNTDVYKAAGEEAQQYPIEQLNEIVHADTYFRDAYQNLQTQFNEAYDAAKMAGNKDDLNKLETFRLKIQEEVKDIEEPTELFRFGDLITEGVNVLRSVKQPSMITTLKDFTLNKSSDTFSNLAYNSYKEFKNNAPIISIENPPAGSAPLDRAEDLKALVKKSREKLARKLQEEQRMSQRAAEKQAEKLIGVTWDVGHINMIRKFGYSEEDTVKQAEIVAPYVKHVHLSDNFGLDHTELPMGMGNVPIGKILELKKGFEKAKKIVETGDWFSRQGGLAQTQSPVVQTLRAFGSPIYSMKMGPSWGGAGATGSYFAGYGATLPQQHFNTYGAGFSGLPQELGGQVQGVSRASGAPVD
jgi:sugar phosphate isomerase/epimerase